LETTASRVRGSARVPNTKPMMPRGTSIANSHCQDAIDLTDFLDQDPTGTRKMVYRMQVLQELTRTANANGHNTIFLTDLTGPSASILPLATRQ
jgi:hypothetical protein